MQPQKEIEMFYLKNLSSGERALCIILGAMAPVFVAMNGGAPGLFMGAVSMAAGLTMTALLGFCSHVGHARSQARQKAPNPW